MNPPPPPLKKAICFLCKCADCAAKLKTKAAKAPECVRRGVFEAPLVKFTVRCQSFSVLALVSWCLSKTHVSETRRLKEAAFSQSVSFAVGRNFCLILSSCFSPFFFLYFSSCRCELRCMFERKLPRTTLQVLNLLRLRPVRVVLRERRDDDETHHRAPHAVYINPGRLW